MSDDNIINLNEVRHRRRVAGPQDTSWAPTAAQLIQFIEWFADHASGFTPEEVMVMLETPGYFVENYLVDDNGEAMYEEDENGEYQPV